MDGKWELFFDAYSMVHDGEGKLAFHKIKPLCKLEEQHVVDLGSGYKNDCIRHAYINVLLSINIFECHKTQHSILKCLVKNR